MSLWYVIPLVSAWRLKPPSSLPEKALTPKSSTCALYVRSTRSEEHTSELQSLMRISYAVFCLKKKKHTERSPKNTNPTNANNHHSQLTVHNTTACASYRPART